MKAKYGLSFVHKFIGIGMLIVGLFLFLQPDAYHVGFQYGKEGTGFSFLQKGRYVLDVYYKDVVSGNQLIVYSNDIIDDKNQPGIEFSRVDIEEGSDKTRVDLELKQDVYSVCIKTALDSSDTNYIERVVIQGAQLQNRDHYFLGSLCVFFAILVFLCGWFVPLEKYMEPAILVGLGLLASGLLFSDFVLGGDDLGFHVARLESVYQGLKAGEFPVYMGSNQTGGFGMLSGTMYPQLFLYFPAMLRFLGVSLMLCYKLLVTALNVGSAFTSYYSAKSMCNSKQVGLWCSVFYTFSIYRLTNIYSRAAIGEALAMVFLPLVIWGIYEVLWADEKKWYLLTLGMGGVLQSHVLTAEMCVFFLMIELMVWLFSKGKDAFGKRILAGVKATVITILVNAFFLVPFLYFFGEDLQCFFMPNELGQTVVYFSQMFALFASAEGRDLDLGSTTGEMSHTIGTVLLLGIIVLCLETVANKEKCKELKIGMRCTVYGILALLMSSWLFPWERIQSIEWMYTIVTSLQFVWRFFSPASALLSMAAAIGVVSFAQRVKEGKWIFAVCLLLVAISTGYYFDMKGNEGTAYSDKMHFNGYGYSDAMYMYSDGESFKALNLNYRRSDAYLKTWNGTEVTYSNFVRKGMQVSVELQAPSTVNDYLVFPFYYYPGYCVLINGEEVENFNLDSLVACELPAGTSVVEAYYKGVTGSGLANGISVLTILGVISYELIIKRRKTRGVRK